MAQHEKKTKKTKVQHFKKNDLYHDIKQEKKDRMDKKEFEEFLLKQEIELVKLQEWVKANKLKVVVIFEGRDAAGKGGVIKTIAGCLNPRICRIVALGIPTEKEKSQWYFQRYASQLPAGGEIVLFDRSWYNRAGVEKVMGYCTNDEYEEFLRSCPEFEKMLIRSGITLIKYWFSVSDKEQEKRFQDRIQDPTKRWKISPMDVESRDKWVEYSMAKDKMFSYTDTKQSPWYVVHADDKRRARLNTIDHLLSLIPYKDLTPKPFKLPALKHDVAYVRPPVTDQTFRSGEVLKLSCKSCRSCQSCRSSTYRMTCTTCTTCTTFSYFCLLSFPDAKTINTEGNPRFFTCRDAEAGIYF